MTAYEQLQIELRAHPKTWMITGVAGFIGSNLLETLLKLDQNVIGIDNFVTGFQRNLDQVAEAVTPQQWSRFRFVKGDICERDDCLDACDGAEIILHQAAINSAPRSIDDPYTSHHVNVDGFVTLFLAARDSGVKRFVYASSSTVYGDDARLPKVEENIGRPLSPYGATKQMGEQYAYILGKTYDVPSIGLRYFNVFGARQTFEGGYAAVIPVWVTSMLRGEPVYINGDGSTSRDFCYIANAVQANLLAGTTTNPEALDRAYNVAVGDRTTLTTLFDMLKSGLKHRDPSMPDVEPIYRGFRAGDVPHSLADISKARNLLGYEPTHKITDGIDAALDWYCTYADK
jgi:UDP-N-acetylglucosamine 4-epimerase